MALFIFSFPFQFNAFLGLKGRGVEMNLRVPTFRLSAGVYPGDCANFPVFAGKLPETGYSIQLGSGAKRACGGTFL
jgi:hypothetical protein